MIATLPPQVLAALIVCLLALIAMAPAILREGSKALSERNSAHARFIEAEAALALARAASGDAALAFAREDRAERKDLLRRVAELEEHLHAALMARAKAEEMRADAEDSRAETQLLARAMLEDFTLYHASVSGEELRAGRLPRRTPQAFPAFARFDKTVPFGTVKGT